MFIYLQDSIINESEIAAITRSAIPATNFSPVYYTVCVYLKGNSQPIVHTYETEEERNEVFDSFANLTNEDSGNSN